jgi:4-oxalocrotonate tautomerase family enzyme
MPIVHVEVFAGRPQEQKIACAREIVRVISEQFNLPAEATQVIFSEVERNNWLRGAELLPATRGK